MDRPTLSRKDWLLLVLWSADRKPLSPVQLQKTLFLLKENAGGVVGADFYNFVPYNYGPFDPDIYSDAEELQAQDLVAIGDPPGQRWKNYALTQKGSEESRALSDKLDSQVTEYVHKLVGWVLSLDFNTLLQWIYTKYPRYRENSVFQG